MIFEEYELIDFFNNVPKKDEWSLLFESEKKDGFVLHMFLHMEGKINVSLWISWNDEIIFSGDYNDILEIKKFQKNELVVKLRSKYWIFLRSKNNCYTIELEDKSEICD